eukprot:jgi/Picre1/33811/NNA_001290.t1
MTGGESQPASEGPAQGTAGPVRDVHMSEENLSSSSDESSDRTSNTMVDRKKEDTLMFQARVLMHALEAGEWHGSWEGAEEEKKAIDAMGAIDWSDVAGKVFSS